MKKEYNALILSGGGSKGAFETGALNYIIGEKNIYFDVITGISVGSLNASILAQKEEGEHEDLEDLKMRLDILNKLWKSIIKRSDVCKLNLCNLFKNGIFYLNPLYKLLKKNLNQDLLKVSPRKLITGFTSLNDGNFVYVNNKTEDIHKSIIAGCSIPGVFSPTPVKINNEINLCADGGTRRGVIIQEAIESIKKIAKDNGDEDSEFNLYIILLFPINLPKEESKDLNTILEILLKTTNILLNEILRKELDDIINKNKEIKNNIAQEKYKIIKVHIIEKPEYKIKGLGFNQKVINDLLKLGYDEAKKNIKILI